MKKTYIEPSVQVISMHAMTMLAMSVDLNHAESHTTGGDLTGTKSNGFGSNIWGDDEE